MVGEQLRLLREVRDLLRALVGADPVAVQAYRNDHAGHWPYPDEVRQADAAASSPGPRIVSP